MDVICNVTGRMLSAKPLRQMTYPRAKRRRNNQTGRAVNTRQNRSGIGSNIAVMVHEAVKADLFKDHGKMNRKLLVSGHQGRSDWHGQQRVPMCRKGAGTILPS